MKAFVFRDSYKTESGIALSPHPSLLFEAIIFVAVIDRSFDAFSNLIGILVVLEL